MPGNKDNMEDILSMFLLYEQKMYHIASAILHDSHQAEDAVMDAFVRLLEHHYKVDDPESDTAKRLVISVTRSAAIDLYRKNQRASSKIVLTEDPSVLRIEEYAEPIPDLDRNAESIIQGLPDIYHDVMYERYVNEKSISETAETLGISESAVRKRQERALKLLRKERKNGRKHIWGII